MDPQVRAKRLAKFTQNQDAKPVQKSVQKPVEKPVEKLVEKPLQSDKPITPKKTVSGGEKFLQMTDADWQHRILGLVFDVAASESESVGRKCFYLEYDSFRADDLEGIVYARLSDPRNAQSESLGLFDYLVGVWRRCNSHMAAMQALLANDLPGLKETVLSRVPVLKAVQELVIGYSGIVLDPEMSDNFPCNHSHGAGYMGHLLMSCMDPESVLPRVFMDAFIARFNGEELPGIVSATVKCILTGIRDKRVYMDYQPPIRALGYLVSFTPLAKMIVALPEWKPSFATPRTLEILSILGPFFSRTSIFPDSDTTIAAKYFGSSDPYGTANTDAYGESIGTRNHSDIKSAQASLRDASSLAIKSIQDVIVMPLVKAGPETKEGVLDFLGNAIKLNVSRGKMQVDRKDVGTDGFFHSLVCIALGLCDPIMTPNFNKLSLIDPYYLFSSPRLDFSEETHINADKHTYDAFVEDFKTRPVKPANFVSEIFYLTLSLHHYGLMSTIRNYGSFLKELDHMKKECQKYTQLRDAGWIGMAPHNRSANEAGLKRLMVQVDNLVGHKLALDAGLLDQNLLEHSMRYYSLVMVWLMNMSLSNPSNVSWDRFIRGDPNELSKISLFPMAGGPSKVFVALPEWIVDDICEFYLFVARHKPTMFENHPRDEIMTFSQFVLMNPSSMKNPYLKSKLVEILFFFTRPLYMTRSGEAVGRLDEIFSTHMVSKKYLIQSVLHFYVDVEQTGMARQFYDKFNIRYNISQILKSVWTDPVHRQEVVRLSRDTEFFVKFAALLMNDTTYLLDEGLSKLKEIGQLQIELAVPLAENAPKEDVTRRQERESLLSQSEQQATSYMSLGNETVHLLSYLTDDPETVTPFMATEVVERFAAMLDFNLTALAGPRCTELKVKNPEKYRFDPKKLLAELVDIFLHLSHRTEFVHAISKDGRSYHKSVFDRASEILTRFHLASPDKISKLMGLVRDVEETLKNTAVEEEELGDIPDDFLDPILCTLMTEPVKLPSGVTCDLSMIKTHLLSDKFDPFNRQPLSLEDIKPDEDMILRIREWKQSLRKPALMETD